MGLASFWFDGWLDGALLKDMAPSLFWLASRKSISVCDGIREGGWRINSDEEIDMLLQIWSKVQCVGWEGGGGGS